MLGPIQARMASAQRSVHRSFAGKTYPLLVSLADKTHSAEAILFDLQSLGDNLWDRFNGGANSTRWYYNPPHGSLCSSRGGRFRAIIVWSELALRNYKPRGAGHRSLARLGVERAAIEKVQRHLSRYRDPLLPNFAVTHNAAFSKATWYDVIPRTEGRI